MDRTSLFKISGLPDAFGAVLLILALILLLSPYFSGGDFGIFKIPVISLAGKRWLKLIGPIAFVLCILSFLPVIPTTNPKSADLVKEDQENVNTSVPSPTLAPPPTASPTPKPTSTPLDVRLAAAKLGAEWFTATDQGDAATLIRIADPPFLFSDKLLLQPEDIREEYLKAFERSSSSGRPRGGNLQLRSTTVETIASMEGAVLIKRDAAANDQLLQRHRLSVSRLGLADDDLVVILRVEGGHREIAILYPRKVGSGIRLAGWLFQ